MESIVTNEDKRKIVEIPLTQGKVALVDEIDFERLNKLKWAAQKDTDTFYAVKTIAPTKTRKGFAIKMHRLILDCPKGMQIDHRDNNGLNNTRSNLRICTASQNQMNRRKLMKNASSIYKGVSWHKKQKRWHARIVVNGTLHHLGSFTIEKEAGLAYDRTASEWFGEYANVNF